MRLGLPALPGPLSERTQLWGHVWQLRRRRLAADPAPALALPLVVQGLPSAGRGSSDPYFQIQLKTRVSK